MDRLAAAFRRWIVEGGTRAVWVLALVLVLGGCRAELRGTWASDSTGGEVVPWADSARTVDHYRRRALAAEVRLYCLEQTVSDTLRIGRALESCKYPHHHEGGP